MKDYFAISNDELAKAEPEEPFVVCDRCKGNHPLEHRMSTGSAETIIGLYKCGDSSYLYSINGKRV